MPNEEVGPGGTRCVAQLRNFRGNKFALRSNWTAGLFRADETLSESHPGLDNSYGYPEATPMGLDPYDFAPTPHMNSSGSGGKFHREIDGIPYRERRVSFEKDS
jgi:hypothetical protein